MAQNIAVIGAGVMGCDLALCLAAYDHQVILIDADPLFEDSARKRIRDSLRRYSMLQPTFKSLHINHIFSAITFTTEITQIRGAGIVVENITENSVLKTQLYEKMAGLLQQDTLVGVNTSCIPIGSLAVLLPQPENVVGMHFMNPVPLKPIVEVIRSAYTSPAALAAAKTFLHGMSKSAVVVNDAPGFVVNRLSHLFMNEAACLVQEKVAAPEEIDLLFKKGYGHAMGPLETADLIGLDTVVNSLQVLYDSFNDPKYNCSPLLKEMVKNGLLGRKTGQGFYRY